MAVLAKDAPWATTVKRTKSTALVAVRRKDGSQGGYRVPRTSLVDAADRQRKRKSA